MSTGKKLLVSLAALVVAEALTFYAYSLLWLAESQPKNHGDPQLKAWAWLCLGAMLLELVIFLVAFFRWHARAGQAPGQESAR